MSYNKYSNKKVTIDGYKFDSKKEAKRYSELKLLLRAGKIQNLTLQPKFILQESFKHEGKTHREISYVSDFKYIKDGQIIVEDVKSEATKKIEVYRIKKKLFLKKYGDTLHFIET